MKNKEILIHYSYDKYILLKVKLIRAEYEA